MAVTAKKFKEYLRLTPDIYILQGDASVDFDAFAEAVKESGTYTFMKGESGWALNGSVVTLSEYGIVAAEAETEIVIKYEPVDVDTYLQAAKSKASASGIPTFDNNAQYDLFIMALAAMYFDNRGMTFQNPADAANSERMVNSFVLELRYAKEDPAE